MRQTVDPAYKDQYPANIQAILKRAAPCAAWLGQELLEIDAETGWCRIAYSLGESQFNRFGAVHGGAIACVMDDVLSVAAGLVLAWGEIAPTLEMKVSYLNQAGAGRHIGEASVRKRGRQISFLEASLMREDGRIVATASGTIMISALKRPQA
ncbi:MAG: PaaI family thioesterase [Rhizomicrobium sp.]